MQNRYCLLLLLTVSALFSYTPDLRAEITQVSPSEQPSADRVPLVISDVDDTLKQTYVRASGHQRWKFYWYSSRTDRPFARVSQVLYNLVCSPDPLYNTNCDNYDDDAELNRSSLYYVTGSPGPLSKFGSEFLEDMQFPQGFLYYRPLGQNSTRDYKIGAIRKILSQNLKKSAVVFLGDNGQYDPEVYHTVSLSMSRAPVTLIRNVYTSPIASPLYPGQLAFFTSGDLALALHLNGLMKGSDARKIIENTLRSFQTSPSSVIPEFMSCGSWRSEIVKLKGLVRTEESQALYEQTWSTLLQICR